MMREFLAAACLALPAGACPDLLCDNGSPNGENGLPCLDWPSQRRFFEVADDFNIAEPGWHVDRAGLSVVTEDGHGAGFVDAVRVRFFEDIGDRPAEGYYAERMADFTDYETGDYYFDRPEVRFECTFDRVTLAAGKWWVVLQPVLEDISFWLTSDGLAGDQPVWASDWLCGGDWHPGSFFFGEDYEGVNFQLSGTIVPEPGLISLVVAAALSIGYRRLRRR